MSDASVSGEAPRADTAARAAELLDVANLRVSFDTEAGEVRAVDGVSFAVRRGEVLALVGESGSGKSTIGLTLMGLTRRLGARMSGAVRLEEEDLLGASERELQALRGRRMAMVFQDPISSLNPVQRVGWQISEQIRAHQPLVNGAQALEQAVELMDRAGIADARSRVRAYPHELSGGMRQRVMIAMALSCEPGLLIADEPTTALDVTTQAQILAQLRELRERTEMGILFITHDLGVVAELADRILVMRGGQLVEQGEADAILQAPAHPYTQSLLAAYAPRPVRSPRAWVGPQSSITPGAAGGSHYSTGLGIAGEAPLEERAQLQGRALLQARELSVTFRGSRRTRVQVLDSVSLTLGEGETLGVVGESGAGKTTLIRCLIRLTDASSGTIHFRGQDITKAKGRQLTPVRRDLQMVFQDSHASLNPRRRVEWILQTGLRLREVPHAQWRERATELLERVGLRAEHLERYPHELSGGERQRVGIARALSCDPRALVLDEPVSSLDATVRAQVLDLLVRLQEEGAPTRPLSYLLVSHDLMVVRGVSDRVAVMRNGKVVEVGPTEELFRAPQHEYTQALLAACLKLPGQVRSAV